MLINILAILLGIVLFFSHFHNDKIFLRWKKHSAKIASFVAGISVSYLFLYLFPKLYEGVEFIKQSVYVYALVGFILLHIVEKQIRQSKSIAQLKSKLKREHSVIFFIYHFMLGIILLKLLHISLAKGILFFVIILFHSTVSTASLKEIHSKLTKKTFVKIILCVSTLLGILLAFVFTLPAYVFYGLVAFVSGALLYIVIRDIIPKESKSNLMYFIFGSLLYLVLIMFTWL